MANARGWHLQVCNREWVNWWYGPLPEGARGHIAPAMTVLNLTLGNGTEHRTELPFELPEHRQSSTLLPPQEHERIVTWGWRIRTNDGMNDCGWHLADSKEAAIEAARAWIEREYEHHGTWREEGMEPEERIAHAVNDVREYETGLW